MLSSRRSAIEELGLPHLIHWHSHLADAHPGPGPLPEQLELEKARDARAATVTASGPGRGVQVSSCKRDPVPGLPVHRDAGPVAYWR
eukprot:2474468-Rhodomonas_salina.1